eukprot:CAMPEP_0204299018 /NCGR_PEP_ID=MMETSP0468-20130131/76027_1 /ASSEMBLY_ACC=CAM_ASM_000383 /TAXON_ID=2969 /ORGANISM="Oxyrrhis marina" /LENGTH=34 /DNA_ID= /DNA_START= /DNA_END= /DNA_ORIENTATION=
MAGVLLHKYRGPSGYPCTFAFAFATQGRARETGP